MYCLCVNVHCTAATGWQPNCSNKYIKNQRQFSVGQRCTNPSLRVVRVSNVYGPSGGKLFLVTFPAPRIFEVAASCLYIVQPWLTDCPTTPSTSEHRTAGNSLRHAEMIAVRRRAVNLVIFTVWRVIWNRMSFCYCGYPLNCRLLHQMSVFTAVCPWQQINSSPCYGRKWKGTSHKITGTKKGWPQCCHWWQLLLIVLGVILALCYFFIYCLFSPCCQK